MTNVICVSSSGAARRDASTTPRSTSRVSGRNSTPPVTMSDRVEADSGTASTMPKLPPPPRTAQNRSGSSSSLTVTTRPSAVTRSTATQAVDRQAVLAGQPADAAAEGQAAEADASRCRRTASRSRAAAAAVVYSPAVGPPGPSRCARTGSMSRPASPRGRSAGRRRWRVDAVAAAATAISRPSSRGDVTARATSAASPGDDHRRLAVDSVLWMPRASSYASSSGG